MTNSTDAKNTTCNRRGFLQLSAGAIAGIALMSMPKLSFAAPITVTTTNLHNCPVDPLTVANSSEIVRNSYKKIIDLSKSIQNNTLRQKVVGIIENPVPSFMEQYRSDSRIKDVYQRLLNENLVDPAKLTWQELFPKCTSTNQAPQPFISAPGSGYGSHHSYPGGLVTHTATNLLIADAICTTYTNVYGYSVDRDTVIAGEALHDLAKPWVFQWNADGSSFKELPIAGTGSHHVLSIAESIYRGLPADTIVAQACAHSHPGSAKEEASVVAWIKAGAIIAGKNPLALGLLNNDGTGLPAPHQQAGYIVHLADHDFVLSVPAAQKSIAALQKIAKENYGMSEHDLTTLNFNKFRNYLGAQLSFMRINQAMTDNTIKKLVASVIKK